MSADDPTPEDIAGLFRKFGGDAHGYKEFAPPEAEAEAPRVWPLLTGEKIAHPPVTAAPMPAPAPAPVPFAMQPPAPQARVEPVLRAPAPVPPLAATPDPALFAQPMTQPAPRASDPVNPAGAAPTPLEQLFERLAGPQAPAPAAGPMSRWRRPT